MTDFTASAVVLCPCGCEEGVAIDFGGFGATEVTVLPCAKLKGTGIVSYTMRKSAALGLQLAPQGTPIPADLAGPLDLVGMQAVAS